MAKRRPPTAVTLRLWEPPWVTSLPTWRRAGDLPADLFGGEPVAGCARDRATLPPVAEERVQAEYRKAAEIRAGGAIGSLVEGVELDVHGVPIRLVAWPGIGSQTEAVPVLTLHPGANSSAYTSHVSEEAMVCLAGRGEVNLRGAWWPPQVWRAVLDG